MLSEILNNIAEILKTSTAFQKREQGGYACGEFEVDYEYDYGA
jgi:hypothetical protein